MRNTFGNLFTLTTFGESHGAAVGGVIDGMPAGIDIDINFIQQELDRRRPGQSSITTSRQEADKVELLSGVFEGKSTGCPIGFIVRNTNQHSQDYENLRCLFRPSHADFTYKEKYGNPSQHIEEFTTDIHNDDFFRKNALENGQCNYKSIWEIEGGRIVITLVYFQFKYYVLCGYVDEQNEKALRQTIIDDI